MHDEHADNFDEDDELDDLEEVVYGHDGYPLRSAAIAIGDPSPELGQVLSADSTFDIVKPQRSALRRIIYGLILGFICGGWGLLVPYLQPGPRDNLMYTIGVFFMAIGLYLAWIKTRFEAETNYVGQWGIERCLVRGSPTTPPVRETLLFSNAAALRVVHTRLMLQTVLHTATQFEYTWTDAEQKKIFVIKGMFGAKESPLKQGHAWHFAQVTEAAWTDFVYNQMLEQYERHRCLEFSLEKGTSILVCDDYLEYRTPENALRIQAPDLETAELVDGWFTFAPRDEARFGNTGKIKFHYSKLANAQAFVRALEDFFDFDPDDFTATSSPLAIGIIS